MPTYRTYDHIIRSDVRFPELKRDHGEPDAEIRIKPVKTCTNAVVEESSGLISAHRRSESYLAHEQLGRMVVEDGSAITIEPVPDAHPGQLRQFLLGTGLRTLFHQRGHLILHASAIDVQGAAVAFIGPSGAGKSTIAAGAYAAGHGVVADDMVTIRPGESLHLPPGFPRLKLGESAAETFDLRSGGSDGLERPYHATEESFPSAPLPLRCIYLVTVASNPGIELLSPGEGVYSLLRNTYSTYRVHDNEAAADHFERCSRVVKRVPVKRLRRPANLDRVPELVEMVQNDR